MPPAIRPAHAFSAPPDASDTALERVVDGLLDGLNWQTRVFHVGQYCGQWRASTHGRAQASFHLVLSGRCWLHRPGHPAVALNERDAVLLMQDVPHFLSPREDAGSAWELQAMRPLRDGRGDAEATGLACGFLSFGGPLHEVLAGAFGDVLVVRAQGSGRQELALLFDLMMRESLRAPECDGSAALDRLCALLVLYAWRELARHGTPVRGLFALLRRPGFAELVQALLDRPQQDWRLEDMARRVHLSRAALFRHFQAACGQSPLQFLLLLRMQLAARRLTGGEPIARVATAVGYESVPAFSRAFKRVMGVQPGAWQRGQAQPAALAGADAAANGHQDETFGH